LCRKRSFYLEGYFYRVTIFSQKNYSNELNFPSVHCLGNHHGRPPDIPRRNSVSRMGHASWNFESENYLSPFQSELAAAGKLVAKVCEVLSEYLPTSTPTALRSFALRSLTQREPISEEVCHALVAFWPSANTPVGLIRGRFLPSCLERISKLKG